MDTRKEVGRQALRDALLFFGEMAKCHRCESCAKNAQQWMHDYADASELALSPPSGTPDLKLLGIKPQPGLCNARDVDGVLCVAPMGHEGDEHRSVVIAGLERRWTLSQPSVEAAPIIAKRRAELAAEDLGCEAAPTVPSDNTSLLRIPMENLNSNQPFAVPLAPTPPETVDGRDTCGCGHVRDFHAAGKCIGRKMGDGGAIRDCYCDHFWQWNDKGQKESSPSPGAPTIREAVPRIYQGDLDNLEPSTGAVETPELARLLEKWRHPCASLNR